MTQATPAAPTLCEIRRGTAWITLNSPETRNALSAPLVAGLGAHLRAAFADESVRSVVVTGAGKAFCAGADLKNKGMAGEASGGDSFVDVLRLMRHGDKPVIAAVNGASFGGGLGLVAAADIAIAVGGAKMSFSEVRIGVIPAIISVVVLPKLGEHLAMRLFLTGERFTSERARDYGLLHAVVPTAELEAAVQRELDAIHLGGPGALREAKQLIRTVTTLSEEEAFAFTEKKSVALFQSDEAAEGMRAFVEKRAPRWAREER